MTRRRTKKQSKKKRGGGFIFTGAAISPGNLIVQPNPQSGGPDCLSQARSGELSNLSLHQARVGLPGMSGGRYTFDLSQSLPGPFPPQAVPIPCERGTQNPLNLRGGKRRRSYHGGNRGPDTASISIPTAGYENRASTAGGIPLLLQVPQNGRACVTGGSRRHRRRHRRRSHRRTYRRHR